MRKILSIIGVSAMAITLAFFAGCGEDKGKKTTSAATAPAVASMKTEKNDLNVSRAVVKAETLSEEMEQAYASASATAIPNAAGNSAYQPASAAKSSYRLSQEARAVTVASATPARSSAAAGRTSKAEIDADLVNFGRGNTGASTRYLDLDGPEIGRDIDAPKFVVLRSQRNSPYAQVPSISGKTVNREVGPEIGWVTDSKHRNW